MCSFEDCRTDNSGLLTDDSSADYDTDIESEGETHSFNTYTSERLTGMLTYSTLIPLGQSLPAVDYSGLNIYMKTCRKLKLSPLKQVCKGLKVTHSIQLRNRGLDSRAMLSLANALMVWCSTTFYAHRSLFSSTSGVEGESGV